MLTMFLAGFLVMLPLLGEAAGVGRVDDPSSFWEMGRTAVWTGTTPGGGAPEIGFWHVTVFAWICNLAMHLGLSDMALFRYARRARYGLFSAFGMFLGHYLAWIWAGVMGAGAALMLKTPLTELDSGAVAFAGLGVAGAVAVVIAGWTTSNPTLYRAGLALQAVTPDWPRWKVTLAAGAVTTVIACFPFVFTKLLDFVGIYGLLLSPAGAIVVSEHWIFPRIGLERCWAGRKGVVLNWPALAAWGAGVAVALVLWQSDVLHLFFLFAPAYVITSVTYIVLAPMAGAREGGGAVRTAPDQAAATGVPLPAAEQAGPEETSASPQPSGRVASGSALDSRGSALGTFTGLIALACLAACVVLPLTVYLAGIEGYEQNLGAFRMWLLLPSAIYFPAATIWQIQRMKKESANR
jgi:NCS1 family nucleobase:cation symporter-1